MQKETLTRTIAELAELKTQLQITKSEHWECMDSKIVKVLEIIALLQSNKCCDEEVEAVNANISLYYMNRVDVERIATSMEPLIKKLKEMAQ